jgi:hypothetical protein
MTTPTRFQFRQPLVLLSALFAVASLHAAPATSFKFQFGDDQAAPGYTLISPTQMYSKDTGYGFEPGANVTNLSHAVTAAQPFLF